MDRRDAAVTSHQSRKHPLPFIPSIRAILSSCQNNQPNPPLQQTQTSPRDHLQNFLVASVISVASVDSPKPVVFNEQPPGRHLPNFVHYPPGAIRI